jgi:hypothetical protein
MNPKTRYNYNCKHASETRLEMRNLDIQITKLFDEIESDSYFNKYKFKELREKYDQLAGMLSFRNWGMRKDGKPKAVPERRKKQENE